MKEMSKMELVNVQGGRSNIAYWTGRILGELFGAYGEANPGPRQCPI